jgi:hypothetical protein
MKYNKNIPAYLYLLVSLLWVFILGNYITLMYKCQQTIETYRIVFAILFIILFIKLFLKTIQK